MNKELFKKLLEVRDEFFSSLDLKDEVNKDDVYNGMMTLLNVIISEQPELIDVLVD